MISVMVSSFFRHYIYGQDPITVQIKYFHTVFLFLLLLISCDRDHEALSGFPEVRIATAVVSENNLPLETVYLNAVIERPWPEDIAFTLSTEGRSAQPGKDFEESRGIQYVIPAGSLSVTVPVGIIGDTLMEFTEQFILRIGQETIQDAGDRQTVITILNDDFINPEWTVDGASTSINYPGMQLVWHDEFEGNAVNTDYWNHDAANAFPVNCGGDDGQIGKYTGDPIHLRQENGNLILTATVDPVTGIYRTSRINSQEKAKIRFGRIDIRAKLAGASGAASGLSMIGSGSAWPSAGEIEIARLAGNEKAFITAGIVYENDGPGFVEKQFGIEAEDRKPTEFFHIYTLLWEEDRITWLLDFEPCFTLSRLEFTGKYLFNEPFFFRINLAVGGLFAGDPADPALFPSDMKVDYVRVYQQQQINTEP